MGTPFAGIDIVDVGVDVFSVAIVVLHGNFYRYIIHLTLNMDGFIHKRVTGGVEVAYKIFYATRIMKSGAVVFQFFIPFVCKYNSDFRVQEGKFPHPVCNDVEHKLSGLGKNLRIRFKANGGPSLIGGPYCFEGGLGNTSLKLHDIDLSIPVDLHTE